MKLVVLGLTLSSSWGNGHATTYRALLKAFAARGHEVLFLECDRPWYANARDLTAPSYCELIFYNDLADLDRHRAAIEAADLVMIGSYVVDGIELARKLRVWASRLAFYDIDTPVTIAALGRGDCAYVSGETIPLYDHYFSFTGGPTLRRLERWYGARQAQAFYCAVDPELYHPAPSPAPLRWHFGYLGTYSADRQTVLDRLLLEPARRSPDLRFVVAGPQYPDAIDWPENVDRIDHLPPAEHADFYNSLGCTLNVTRTDMVAAGFSPSVRLFEAAACATPILSDPWRGLDTLFRPGIEILIAETTEQALHALARPAAELQRIGQAARRAVLSAHTAAHRALALEQVMENNQGLRSPIVGSGA